MRAAARAAPRNGSSPLVPCTRPQRGSRVTSTIGLNVHLMPSAVASEAAIDASLRASAGSQLLDSPSEIGYIVL